MLLAALLLPLGVLALLSLAWTLLYRKPKSACVIVLGDFGRSPRMQYHTLSLAEEYDVCVVANGGSTPLQAITQHPRIRIFTVPVCPALPKGTPNIKLLFQLYAPFKVGLQTVFLLGTLLYRVPAPSFFLLQNPPAIPTLPLAWLVARLRRSKLVVDWHNYGYTLLGLSLGSRHWLVKLAHWIERTFGACSDAGLCVTDAMREDLRVHWGVSAQTFHDRPTDLFAPTSPAVAHDLFTRLSQDYPFVFRPFPDQQPLPLGENFFTSVTAGGDVVRRARRPALLVSGTSWTPDEDFGLLLEALKQYEGAARINPDLPKIVCLITGKGPLREYYEQLVASLELQCVRIGTMWLRAEDYPRLLGAADLGVSLHTSSSGLDLPMKVVDMFGAGLPVCAADFACIGELVVHKKNGLVFSSANQLSVQLQTLLSSFPSGCGQLQQLRQAVLSDRARTWSVSWQAIVRPLLAKFA